MKPRFRLTVPDTCPECRGRSTVKLEHTIKGSSVTLSWCCHQCSHGWVVNERDVSMVERRRSDAGERRAYALPDRRGADTTAPAAQTPDGKS